MSPRLPHLPSQMIRRIPGPPPLGSRRARAVWGMPYYPLNGWEGMPDGQLILDHWNNTGTPTWFAISDYGAGFIPWGFWQVVMYPVGESSGAPFSHAYAEFEVDVATPSWEVAGSVHGSLSALQGSSTFEYPACAGFRFREIAMNPGTAPGYTDRTAGVIIEAPWGLTRLANYYNGETWGPPDRFPMIGGNDGYDNPQLLALWGPGQRACIPLGSHSDLPDYPYTGYPYPGPPYYEREPT